MGIQKLVPTWRFLKQTSPEKYGTGVVGLLKNFWGECSGVAVCTVIGVFSVIGVYMTYLEEKETHCISNKPYKQWYTVYRPDDPRITKLKEEWYKNGSPPMTTSRKF